MKTFSSDFAYRAAEATRRRAMRNSPDEIGTSVADFICLFVLMLWLLDLACWGAK